MNKNNDFDTKEYYKKLAQYTTGNKELNTNNFLLVATEAFVSHKMRGVTKTQMRNIFELFKNCKTSDEVKMTKPKLIYTAGRLSGEGKFFLIELSKNVMNVKDTTIAHFQKYVETVLAYHKFYANN
jgi:CRISPR type III-A-associated protein Csm2